MGCVFGYAGRILRVDLGTGRFEELETKDYAEDLVGGRGVAAKIYWDEVPPGIKAFDPENRLIFITGPLAGVAGLAGSRWQVCGRSPATSPELFCYSNLGGNWGSRLKSAGYDGVVIHGEAEKPVFLLVEDGRAELRDASRLWGMGAARVREVIKQELGGSTSVVSVGMAGENRVVFASLLADDDSSGSGGLGAVMGSKMLKAIAVRGRGRVDVAHRDRLMGLRRAIRASGSGTAIPMVINPGVKPFVCRGCASGCVRSVYRATDGKVGKVMCQSGLFYQKRSVEDFAHPRGRVTGAGEWDEEAFNANRLCDEYGLDTNAVEVIINWLVGCFRAGVVSEESVGLPLSRVGGMEFIEALVQSISLRRGFGDVLARGCAHAAKEVGSGAEEILSGLTIKAGQDTAYDPRLYIVTGLFYAMEPRQPVQQLHEVFNPILSWLLWIYGLEGSFASGKVIRSMAERFWGSQEAADFTTYRGKALAAKMIQDRQYAYECLILCNFAWPKMLLAHSSDHVGDPSIESKVFSAVTGRDMDEEGLYTIGERVFNLQRAIHVREGHGGREKDVLPDHFYCQPLQADHFNPGCLVPGRGGDPVSRQGQVVDKDEFEGMKDEYYALRGWDVASGLQKESKLRELGLGYVAKGLKRTGLVV